MSELPSGTVTFLFTDIEGSTQLWEKHPEEMKKALAEHDRVLREAISSHRGITIKTTGDGFHAVFEKAIDAIQAAIQAQSELHSVFTNPSESICIWDFIQERPSYGMEIIMDNPSTVLHA
jgi:class 3 adenylate cyclase